MKLTEYQQKMNRIKLGGFVEHKNMAFSMGATMILCLIFMLASYDFIEGKVNTIMLTVACLYLIMSLYMYVVLQKIKKDIVTKGTISNGTRRLGWPMTLFVLTGNFFGTIGGMYLLSKKKCIEYQLAVYMVANLLMVMLVSTINIFKPAIPYYFDLGMGLLAVVLVFYIFVAVMLSKHADEHNIDPRLKKLLIPLALSVVTGNLFALILVITMYKRLYQKNKEISIEWIDIMRRLFRNYMSVIGMFIVIFLVSISICSYLTFDYAVSVENNYSALFQPPSLAYPFGTDNFGRCIFSRIVFGARISLSVGMAAIVIPLLVGGTLGSIAGYYGKAVDNVIMRALDTLYAIPSILLAIAIIASFGASTISLIMAISIAGIPVYARLVRATVLGIANSEYVEAAKACGATNRIIIFKHIVPNSLAPLIVRSTLEIGTAVLSTSTLSYLGIGIPAHIPEWGNVLRAGSTYLEEHPYMAIFPGLAIILIVLAFNFFGDGLRDALDPKMK
ncbi:ABC transporter permease [Enterocloster lavalensis]|uniref:ABC transporter permease n=1 Tax=Enterocloster lavalensis TaxID=460384 RepID=UPI0026665883|nr:ABC transporter permease [Enterocloster lavalensis]